MKWIEIKMRELRVSTHSDYKLTAFLDNTAMVTVHTAQRGKLIPHRSEHDRTRHTPLSYTRSNLILRRQSSSY